MTLVISRGLVKTAPQPASQMKAVWVQFGFTRGEPVKLTAGRETRIIPSSLRAGPS
jgi:hypothetical protein